ncbi:hypothetical protein ACFY9N_16660 [Microbacterium sp. NPDC008134]|uniref:hypothetical protein n=1 Tax=Microbacterium sp. NPDC008134 TaxID=3364183 RepID=UPI0036E17CF5
MSDASTTADQGPSSYPDDERGPYDAAADAAAEPAADGKVFTADDGEDHDADDRDALDQSEGLAR